MGKGERGEDENFTFSLRGQLGLGDDELLQVALVGVTEFGEVEAGEVFHFVFAGFFSYFLLVEGRLGVWEVRLGVVCRGCGGRKIMCLERFWGVGFEPGWLVKW